jgi:hypothetical protein
VFGSKSPDTAYAGLYFGFGSFKEGIVLGLGLDKLVPYDDVIVGQ